ncbi:hypothetical protein VRY85_06150 [Achromobacter sp. F4_2707]|uniref:hypothetical protein n=1 Tax=Achromobacter sp. F4_2707 TaxID=3114286 RepID=UPI0039C6FC64
MSIQTVCRLGLALCVAAVVAGCSSTNPGVAEHSGDARVVTTSLECRWNRSACIYEGRYESGERAYAEDEARRLNQASLDRLRRVR